MRRRQVLQWGAGLALGSLAGARVLAAAVARPVAVIVVGGGIVGASVAYHLARRGARVTLLEKSQFAAGASGTSFAWINANFTKQPRDYHVLSRLGVLGWHTLRQQIGDALPVRFGGTLEWYANPQRGKEMTRLVRQQLGWGYPVELLPQDAIARREPALQPGPSVATAFSVLEGAVDSARATRVLLDEAVKAGATVRHSSGVEAIATATPGGVRVSTSQGDVVADHVVIASGVDTAAVAALAGVTVPLKSSPGVVVRSVPLPPMVNGVMATEDSHFHQQLDGRVIMGDDYSPPAKVELHQLLQQHPRDFPTTEIAGKHGVRIRGQAARYLPALADAEVESVSLCWRPMPRDEYPIIGFAPGSSRVYVTVTHSGVTLAPIIGALAAIELLDGVKVDLLAPYRLQRLFLYGLRRMVPRAGLEPARHYWQRILSP
jgi:glycine/D-amino acid oxidase-like deaminating enzyme